MSSYESRDKARDKRSSNKELAERLAKEHFERLSRIRGDDEKKKEKGSSKSHDGDHKKKKNKESKEKVKEPKEKKKEVFDWDDEYMGYTNSDNPFGDANLLKTFIWTKKYEKMGIKDIDPEEIERQNRIKQKENKRELEKVKERRLQREREREARLEELAKAQREKEALQFKEWEKQEDTFHLKQAKLRSQLRIREGRAKPIDLLARYIDFVTAKGEKTENDDNETPFELLEPYMYLNGLRITDLEDLQEDIKVYMELDDKSNIDYWKDLQTIVCDELQKLLKFQSGSESEVDRREGINTAVSSDVTSVFQGKTLSQLCVLQVQMEEKIRSGREGVDVSYWETLLCKLKAIIAKARLKEHHEQYKKLLQLKLKADRKDSDDKRNLFPLIKTEKDIEAENSASTSSSDNSSNERLKRCIEEYTSGRYSPTLIPENQLEAGTIVVDVEDDWQNLQRERIRIRNEMYTVEKETPKVTLSAAEIAFDKEARRGMSSDETEFSAEECIKQDKSIASWSDKYRPRKPRYFNRVHTGFEWNKYNQTHYDVDNPPPKIVQGYKFNIFYPDLIDKQRTPTYHVTPCSDNRDFAIIRFSAGPPYEDIAFKIVNREWNYSYKSGFRCQFHNNILQLWFHFKRYRYRR